MELNEYQQRAHATAKYPGMTEGYFNYPMTKLAGETGEFCEKVGKFMRRNDVLNVSVFMLSEEERVGLLKELGDIKWYVDELIGLLGSTAEECAQMNLDKLADRAQRGVIDGEGDNR